MTGTPTVPVVNMASESDISVQGHGVHTAYVELAGALERRDDVRLVRGDYHRRTPCDVYHLHTIGPGVLPKVLDRRVPTVVSAHVIPDSLVGSIRLARWWRPLASRYMRWFYSRADVVLAVSGTVARVLREELGIPAERVQVLHNTVDMPAYAPEPGAREAARRELGLDPDGFVVVGVGQVQPRKRVDLFVRMAREHPDVTFVWVGGIPFAHAAAELGKMRRLMADLPPNLRVTDVVPHEVVRRHLHAADVFCLPAEQENHPMCVLEAAGAGLPIVVRDLPEYDDTFGQDVLRCDDDGFSAAVGRLRDDPDEARRWREGAARIARRFDSSTAAERLTGLYRELAAR
ncbi:glycosyltransferase [Ornithinimicrobium humiphilum]|uniref:D-inositol 3-phosphate glycosyltransferase n=1 Tax=Ornithinimicrobium humiphilum TaxID=125288 RepID=A0A543K7S5_9MICO|nr:glycosyltransferase family 4 protein [Ornithinimicrobium humiphilum]TQM91083.1 1,2-diacylglycerol-3-alpha-glucose alpha-1,2-galactosyltransferase [Ornithinimicrobium humiphilum]